MTYWDWLILFAVLFSALLGLWLIVTSALRRIRWKRELQKKREERPQWWGKR